jgi:hypothetical protein
MSDTAWIVAGIVAVLIVVLTARQGELRIKNEACIKLLEAELAIKKEENKRYDIMRDALRPIKE